MGIPRSNTICRAFGSQGGAQRSLALSMPSRPPVMCSAVVAPSRPAFLCPRSAPRRRHNPRRTMVKALAPKQKARKGLLAAANRARTASTAPKTKSRGQVQQGAIDLFNDVEKSDLQFIMKGFEKAPQLVPWLASLMRDGVLEKTLRVKLAGDQPVQLGKKLGEKMKRFRNLPPRFWGLLWLNLWKQAPGPDSKDCKMTLEKHQNLAEWALRINMSGGIPEGHKASQYEAPCSRCSRRVTNSVGPSCRSSPRRSSAAAHTATSRCPLRLSAL